MNPEKIIEKPPFDEALYTSYWFLTTMEKAMPGKGFSSEDRAAVSRTTLILANLIVEDSSCTLEGKDDPLIIQYTSLLHQYRDPKAVPVLAFVEVHKDNAVLMRRVETLNKLWELKR